MKYTCHIKYEWVTSDGCAEQLSRSECFGTICLWPVTRVYNIYPLPKQALLMDVCMRMSRNGLLHVYRPRMPPVGSNNGSNWYREHESH